jgi:SPP1 gp7 family putative phage head morphogenesis protein
MATRTVDPWTPDAAADEQLAAPTRRAEAAALAVVVPALAVGLIEALDAVPAMAAVLGRRMSDRAIRSQWRAAGRSARRRSARHWRRQLQLAKLEVEPREDVSQAVLEAWVAENIARIQGLRDSVAPAVTRAIIEAQTQGKRATTLARELERLGLPARNGRLRGRGDVIARDQLSKLAGQLARQQQLDAGIVEFVWRTMRDSRVRDSHRDLEGQRFAWGEPPPIGIPGEPINCRCYAEGVIALPTRRA